MHIGPLGKTKRQMQEKFKENVMINDRWNILRLQKRVSCSDKVHDLLLSVHCSPVCFINNM
jgi:hypothetical protein